MQNTHLPEMQEHDAPLIAARRYVLMGHRIPARTQAQLEARGIDVGALEQRLIEQQQRAH